VITRPDVYREIRGLKASKQWEKQGKHEREGAGGQRLKEKPSKFNVSAWGKKNRVGLEKKKKVKEGGGEINITSP